MPKAKESKLIEWYDNAIPAAAREAHRKMMRGDYSGEPIYFYYKPNGLSVISASESDGHPEGYRLVTAERAPGNLEQAQLVRWLVDRTRRLELFPKEGGAEGLDGVSSRTRQGTRVRFNASRASLVLYTRPPEIGEEGTVGTMPGFGKRTYLPGPGGGLLYVDWDNSGMIGVSPNDVERVGWRGVEGLGEPHQIGLFSAKTRGGKYTIEAWRITSSAAERVVYRYETFTSGKGDGVGISYTEQDLRDNLARTLRFSKDDGINYHITHDEIGVGAALLGASPSTRAK
jgi:hypothetical protein